MKLFISERLGEPSQFKIKEKIYNILIVDFSKYTNILRHQRKKIRKVKKKLTLPM